MIPFTNELLSGMEANISEILAQDFPPIVYSEKAIKVIVSCLQKLKGFILDYDFSGKGEEIDFFKVIKPRFTLLLIYYNEIYSIESNRPKGGKKAVRRYLKFELEKLERFFEGNADFFKYYRTGSCYLDKKYFLRGKHSFKFTADSYYYEADHRFCTSHDFKVGKVLANDLVEVYLERELARLDSDIVIKDEPLTPTQRWTGSKVNLVELVVYALHAEGVLNNGNGDLKETMRFFEGVFGVDLGQFHRTFYEMRGRKSERTKFLNSLRETMVRRMDEVDE